MYEHNVLLRLLLLLLRVAILLLFVMVHLPPEVLQQTAV